MTPMGASITMICRSAPEPRWRGGRVVLTMNHLEALEARAL